MVSGVCIVGSRVQDVEDLEVDSTWEPCPVGRAAGVPLVVKRAPADDSTEGLTFFLCSRLMTVPETGAAHADWQYGCALGPAPPVWVARTDGLAFCRAEWCLFDDFVTSWFEEGPRRVARLDFSGFIKNCMSFALENHHPAHYFLDVVDALDVRYPQGVRVKAVGLKTTDLNGAVGEVTGRYENGRVGVLFPDPFGVKALRPQSLQPEFTLDEKRQQIPEAEEADFLISGGDFIVLDGDCTDQSYEDVCSGARKPLVDADAPE